MASYASKHWHVVSMIAVLVLIGATAFAANPPLCPHVIGWGGGVYDWAQGAPWIKVLTVGDVDAGHGRGAQVFYRPLDVPGGDDGCLPTGVTGTQWADAVWAKIAGLANKPEAVGYRNEFNWDPTPGSESRRTCSEFVNYRSRLRQLGYTGKVVFGSFGVGWPDSYVWDEPEVRAATDVADAVETHEYFDLHANCAAPYLAFRHRDLAINAHPDHLGDMEWFIGEAGSDRVCGHDPSCDDTPLCRSGWLDNGKLTEQQFIDELTIYRAGCHDNVTAVFIFQQGCPWGWYAFETIGSTAVSNYLKSTWTQVNVGTIAGSVKDISNNPVSGATVITSPGNYTTTTAGDGSYSLGNIPVGTYSVTASKSGYNPQTQSNISVTSGQTTTVNFTLTSASGQLQNGNFEGGFTNGVANSWTKFILSGGPSFYDCTGPVHGGSHSQAWWTSYSTHEAGIYQQVSVSSGTAYTFSAWTWRHDQWNNTNENETTWVGIDPYGGTNAASANVVWSSGIYSYETWTQQSVTATAQASTITVFVKGKAQWAGNSMVAVVDDAVLQQSVPTTGTISGYVKDTSNNAISGATVSTNTGGYSTTSTANGSYTLSNVAPGTYDVTASKTGYISQTQTGRTVTAGQTTTVNFNLTPSPTAIASENFDSMPSWASSYNASWGSAATWSIVGNGQAGNCLQASRSSQGSSSKVKVYAVPQNTNITISIYMKCPSYGGTYWIESAYRLGNYSAQNFDQDAGNWTLIKKFSNTGTNGNGNVWTQYSTTVNTGANTQISIGYKHGASGCAGPTVYWDTFRIQ